MVTERWWKPLQRTFDECWNANELAKISGDFEKTVVYEEKTKNVMKLFMPPRSLTLSAGAYILEIIRMGDWRDQQPQKIPP